MRAMDELATTAPPRRASPWSLALLGLFTLALLAWHLPSLGHPYLPGWDEAVHAAVAGNLSRHPLTPTLFEQPFVPYDFRDWQANHVWLHMPPLPFWQAAASVAAGGRELFWLRLPNLLLLLATVWLTWGLGRRLLSERAGLLAALLVGLAPFGWLQVQGYHFGDMTDVALAFWSLASIACLERSLATGRLRWALLGGLALGAALLTKSALALAPAGAACVLWAGRWLKLRLAPRLRLGQLATFLLPGLGLWQGWDLYARLAWPREHAHEAMNLWNHVFTNYEGHGRSWDALLNDRLAHLYGPELVLLALAGVALLTRWAWRTREGRLALLPLWLLGTLLPLFLVQTKVPAILYGLGPALALGLGALVLHLTRRGVGAAGLALAG
ncbi:MAG TPA: glycosyltransferase family 39 protein, partial [Myxococcota bacterium]|nr:glycosyltransferase family 39 protein [Myxococcota bacterium]